jgi:hypothetical protein
MKLRGLCGREQGAVLFSSHPTARRPWPRALACLAAGLLAAWPGAARAADASGSPRACQGPNFSWDEQVSDRWQGAARALGARLASLEDIDRCAEVELLGASPGVIAHVVLADGRSAVRRVVDPARLASVVEPLLILLPATAPASSAPLSPPATSLPPAEPAPAPTPAAIEAGLGASAHLTLRPSYLGYGAAGFVQVVVGRWLIGSAARWEGNNLSTGQTLPPGFNMQSFTLGALVGRRIPFDAVLLDVAVGPQLLVENQETSGHDPDGISGLYGDVNLGAVVRLRE